MTMYANEHSPGAAANAAVICTAAPERQPGVPSSGTAAPRLEDAGKLPVPALTLTLEEFLCGASGPVSWCNQAFEDYLNDIDRKPIPSTLRPVPGHPDYKFAFSTDSVLLLHEGAGGRTLVGYYNTPGAVCIHEDHQGEGLGAELILFTAVEWSCGAPTDGLDEQCFSAAGWHAHRRAYYLGRERGLIA